VRILCKALGVSRPGFYAWRRRPPSTRSLEDHRLAVKVRESHERGRRYYGSPRIFRDLKEQGERISRKRVIRIMQEQGLVARVRRRYKCTTMSDHDQPIAPNLLAQRFDAEAPNQRWVGDTTELRLGQGGRLFLAAILDLFSRFVVGWALSAVNDRQLVIRALEMALRRRCPDAGLVHHSDQGSPYASEDYQDVLGALRDHLQHEPTRELLRQRRGRKLVLDVQVRARRAVRKLRRCQGAVLRLHRGLLQPAAPPLDDRLRLAGRVRASAPRGAGSGDRGVITIGGRAAVMYNKTHARRPTKDPKGTLVAVRLSNRQTQVLEVHARREGIGLSEAIRRCVDEWATTSARPPATFPRSRPPTAEERETFKQLAAVLGAPSRRRPRTR
jgi:transposase InsO family protein